MAAAAVQVHAIWSRRDNAIPGVVVLLLLHLALLSLLLQILDLGVELPDAPARRLDVGRAGNARMAPS